MLTTDDVAELFQAMRTAYGGQWKHGPQAVRTWRTAMSQYSLNDLMRAANTAMENHADHPPTLPQFLAILRGPKKQANTYLPKPTMRQVESAANLTLLHVLRGCRGVDSATMDHMVHLKNALIEDHDSDNATREFISNLHAELSALSESSSDEKKAAEVEHARQRINPAA